MHYFFEFTKFLYRLPKITIIIPVYNSENFIGECLISVINQTFKEIEIIVVNDASTDKSLSIIKFFTKKYKQIKLISLKKNMGLAYARNIGVRHAKSNYIMFCDSDDFYEKNMCQILYNNIIKYNVNYAVCGTNIIDMLENNRAYASSSYFSIPYKGLYLLDKPSSLTINCCAWNKIFKREFLIKNNIHFPDGCYHEDEFFFFSCILNDPVVLLIPENLYNYRIRSNSIMYNLLENVDHSNESAVHLLKIIQHIIKYVMQNNLINKRNNQELIISFISRLIKIALRRADNSKKKFLIEQFSNIISTFFDENLFKSSFIEELYKELI